MSFVSTRCVAQSHDGSKTETGLKSRLERSSESLTVGEGAKSGDGARPAATTAEQLSGDSGEDFQMAQTMACLAVTILSGNGNQVGHPHRPEITIYNESGCGKIKR